MIRSVDVASSAAATLLRFGAGSKVVALGRRPERMLELYEFEGCPFCRKVREALSALDLEVMIHPCPKGGPNGRRRVVSRGGKSQFPYLVDPNTGKEMYESDDIVHYLFLEYGQGEVPGLLRPGPLTLLTAVLAGLPRPGQGAYYHNARHPLEPLHLYGYEASPYCRLVRETLCELELPYRLTNVARGSQHRAAFIERAGKMMVPYLVDPNTDVQMFESAEIVAYLRATYVGPEEIPSGGGLALGAAEPEG